MPLVEFVRYAPAEAPCSVSLAAVHPEEPVERNFNHFGYNLDHAIYYAVQWATQNGIKGDFERALKEFAGHARTRYLTAQRSSICLTVRIERQNTAYNIPNPHHDGDDGKYWQAKPGDPAIIKIGTVLLGPGTVFYGTDDPDMHFAVRQSYEQQLIANGTPAKHQQRSALCEKLQGAETYQISRGEMACWVVGPNTSTIHSEPDMSVMPGGRIL
jgi:hypothetical protein